MQKGFSTKRCAYCLKEFLAYSEIRKGSRGKLARGYLMKTCSKKCAMHYTRISRNIKNEYFKNKAI